MNKEKGSDYAPEYTKQEKIKQAIKTAAWAIPLFLISKYWFFPWLHDFASKSHCYEYGSFTGTHVLYYGLFIGVPMFLVILLFAFGGMRSIQVFRLGQFPLPGEKVLSPTKYVYGIRAKIRPVLFFGILIFFVGLSIRGYIWANEIIEKPIKDTSACVNS